MFRLSLAVLAAVSLAGTGVLAQTPDYSASDVIQQIAKGQTREVCIGTTEACAGTGGAPAVEASGFNLLVTFQLGSDALSAQAGANLREFAAALADPSLEGTRFAIEGHTDASGSAAFNEALSVRRAGAVAAFLQALGVDPGRLESTGYGESRLYSPEDPNAAINRRVEAVLIE